MRSSYSASIRDPSMCGQADGDKRLGSYPLCWNRGRGARPRVVSVTTSPLGTTFINFGGEYPNQRFAGYIAAGSKVMSRKQLSTLSEKIVGTIELYQGKPEINIIRAEQIKILDLHTERGAIRL